MTILWPRKILVPQDPMFAFTPMSIHGPISGTRVSDVIQGDVGYWRVTFGSVVVNNSLRIQTWNAISAILDGMSTPILMPYCRARQPIGPNFDVLSQEVPEDDDTLFDDDTGHVGGSTIVLTAEPLAAWSTTGIVRIYAAGLILPGHKFSFGEQLYEIRSIASADDTYHVITFRPPLHEAVYEGTELNFDEPVCRCRLATDTEMDLTLYLNARATPTINLVEDLVP